MANKDFLYSLISDLQHIKSTHWLIHGAYYRLCGPTNR